MEAEPPLYPVAGAAGPQGDEDGLGAPDGPEAPVSGDRDRERARGPGGPGGGPRECRGWGAGPWAPCPVLAPCVPRSWTSWWARTPTTTRRRRNAATTAASASAWSRTCWRPARAACSPTASTWVPASTRRLGPGEGGRPPGGPRRLTQGFPLSTHPAAPLRPQTRSGKEKP